MNYTEKKFKPVEVVDSDTGLIMRVSDLKNKAYRVLEEQTYEEIINLTKWIGKIRIVKIIAEQAQLKF